MSAAEAIDRLVRVVPDFPKPGVRFLDVTPLIADGPALAAVADALVAPFDGAFDVIAGVEARGFALAAAAAARSGHGVVLVRKAGKLPGGTLSESYELEYGEAEIEVHLDQVPLGTRVLVIDDVIATGGTLAATARLLERAGWSVAGLSVAIEIAELGGRAALPGRGLRAIVVR